MNRRLVLLYGAVLLVTAGLTFGVTALLMNIAQRKSEARQTFFRVVELTDATIDPAAWGKNFPREYEGYLRTADTNRTRYGGSEAFSRLDQDLSLRRIFAGYAFGTDYREERGHYYSLTDQKLTERTAKFSQPGACLQCHAGGMKQVYEQVGAGGLFRGFDLVCAMPLTQAWTLVQFPVSCTDCHNPTNLALRATRPAFLEGIDALARSDAPVPCAPSIERWRRGDRATPYDPNALATRQEMRTFVCGQCHVEYYFKGEGKRLTYPWHNGLKAEQLQAYYDEAGFADWTHAETGAKVVKAQHPEFETWNQGIHARSGVACADCHMPYERQGAMKVSDHHVRSPILNASRACLTCHHFEAPEMIARVEAIQDRNRALMDRAETALLALLDDLSAARSAGAADAALAAPRAHQRRAQWRLDFVNAENSMGFHAPQEAARLLAEAIDFARQGQLALEPGRPGAP
jgi:nitrite reductase (cytochrome c-552)